MSDFKVEIVAPVVVDEIEFYVSADGERCGMSISALARLCGVKKSTVQKRIKGGSLEASENTETPLNGESKGGNTVSQESPFYEELQGSNNAKILTSKFARETIEYYAFESTRVSEEVKEQCVYVFRKFAGMGIDSWIRKTTGHIENHDTASIMQAFKEMEGRLLAQMARNEKVASEYKAIREKTTTHYAGLDEMLKNMVDAEDTHKVLSLEAWLWLVEGIILDDTRKRSFRLQVAQTYKSTTHEDPPRANFRFIGKDGEEIINQNTYLYDSKYFPMLKMCLGRVLNNNMRSIVAGFSG